MSLSSPNGIQQVVTVAAPAAGAEWSYTLGAGAVWRILAMHTTFTTSAAAGTRNFYGQYVVGGTRLPIWGGNSTTIVTATFELAWTRTASLLVSSTGALQSAFLGGIPTHVLLPGQAFGSYTPGILAGDQYGATSLLIEQLTQVGPVVAAT